MISRILGTRARRLLLIGMVIILVGGFVVPLLAIPIGLILLGMAFAELRSTSKNAKLLNPRVLTLTGVLAAASVIIAVLLATVPGLQTDFETHGPNDALIMVLTLVDFILVLWLAAASGYLGYALWLKVRFGNNAPEVDGN